MPREVPTHVKTFKLTSISTAAVTYRLHPTDGHGWALATVNDDTYELQIQSDWGNWAYRWHSSGMARTGPNGAPCTLTQFLADRDAGHCDYLADKLTSHADRNQFDSYASVKAMRRMLIEMRLKQGREVIDYWTDDEPEDREDVGTDDPKRHGPWERHKVRCKYTFKDEDWFLTKQTTRTLYDALGELEGDDTPDRFLNQYFQIEGHTIIGDEPWGGECMIYEPSPHYYQLLHGILPALVRACAERLKPAPPILTNGPLDNDQGIAP